MRDNMNTNMNFRQHGFLSLPNDSILKTLLVAVSLCLVCSVIVSTTATMLKPIQVKNKQLDKKKNILTVAGIEDSSKSIDELFSGIETKVVELATGEYTDAVDVSSFDQRKASKDPAYRIELSSEQDIAQIRGLSKYANVYLVGEEDDVSKIILPVKGYGLWSTLYGFLCLESDLQTICGINFYDHNETPGLGGEVDNPNWKQQWQGKKVFNAQGVAEIGLIKGLVEKNTPNPEYKVDGLAGATLTSNGVTNLVRFWVGENGFGPYLQKLQSKKKGKQLMEKQAAESQREIPEQTPSYHQTQVDEALQEVVGPDNTAEPEATVAGSVGTEAVIEETIVEEAVVEEAVIEGNAGEEIEVIQPDSINTQVDEVEVTEPEVKHGE